MFNQFNLKLGSLCLQTWVRFSQFINFIFSINNFESFRFYGNYCELKQTCSPGFYGTNCSVKCVALNNCQKHQYCDYYGNLTCLDGWGNFPACNIRLIDQSIDPDCPKTSSSVQTTSCFNGGSCFNGTCCCASGFTGASCELSIDPCVTSPCQNHALCKPNGNSFVCYCLPGYTGNRCELQMNPCLYNSTLPCFNSGLCQPYLNYTGFTCLCYEGYTGPFCESQINYCQAKPCLNNGSCLSIMNSYYCSCAPGNIISY